MDRPSWSRMKLLVAAGAIFLAASLPPQVHAQGSSSGSVAEAATSSIIRTEAPSPSPSPSAAAAAASRISPSPSPSEAIPQPSPIETENEALQPQTRPIDIPNNQQATNTPASFTFEPLPSNARCDNPKNPFNCDSSVTLTSLVVPTATANPSASGSASAAAATATNSSSSSSGGNSEGGLTGWKKYVAIGGGVIGFILFCAIGVFVWNKLRGNDDMGTKLDELSAPVKDPEASAPTNKPGMASIQPTHPGAGAGAAAIAAAPLGPRPPPSRIAGEPGAHGDLHNLPITGDYSRPGHGRPASPSDHSSETGSLTPSMSASVVRGSSNAPPPPPGGAYGGGPHFAGAPPMPPPPPPQGGYQVSQAYPQQQAPYGPGSANPNGPYYTSNYPQQQQGYGNQQPYNSGPNYGPNTTHAPPAQNSYYPSHAPAPGANGPYSPVSPASSASGPYPPAPAGAAAAGPPYGARPDGSQVGGPRSAAGANNGNYYVSNYPASAPGGGRALSPQAAPSSAVGSDARSGGNGSAGGNYYVSSYGPGGRALSPGAAPSAVGSAQGGGYGAAPAPAGRPGGGGYYGGPGQQPQGYGGQAPPAPAGRQGYGQQQGGGPAAYGGRQAQGGGYGYNQQPRQDYGERY
ncbi:hypothetical protein HDU96_006540 [Phlyctochytrium bullatum]|nr:hypothetical protein HDU96_006540 [Phlyctochytrium bullatum]